MTAYESDALARAEQTIEQAFEQQLDISEAVLIAHGATAVELNQARRDLITAFLPWKRQVLREYAASLQRRVH